jgi:transcriptional regulator GlxA family with amidase domain
MAFGFLLFPGLEELDLVGPWEMFSIWRASAGGPEDCLMVAENLETVSCAKGMLLKPHVDFATCPDLRFLLVPGGQGTRAAAENEALVRFVAQRGSRCDAALSVCTGAFILHRAGFLAGRRATTHWSALPCLRELGDVDVVEERVVRDGKVWTGAGVTAGIDLALALIESVAGEQTAARVQLSAEYYPSPGLLKRVPRESAGPAYLRPSRDAQEEGTAAIRADE